MDKELEKINKSICLQKGIDERVGKAIINALFQQFKEVASETDIHNPETIKNFRIINFGLFYSTADRIKRKKYARNLDK